MLVLLSSVAALAGELDFGQGTWELGGRATANVVLRDGNSDLYLDLSPTFGYFVSENIELLGGVSLFVQDNALGAGFFGGLDAFLSNDGVAPYLGATIGYGTQSYQFGFFQVSGDVVTISGRGGIVIPLNRKVGLDLGARVNFNIEDGDTWVHIPLGYVGIRAFF
jgi:hypothetical protein